MCIAFGAVSKFYNLNYMEERFCSPFASHELIILSSRISNFGDEHKPLLEGKRFPSSFFFEIHEKSIAHWNFRALSEKNKRP
jgi:hypothetical protein